MDPSEFEKHAATTLSAVKGRDLTERKVVFPGGGQKRFDLVSADHRVVGDAKFYGASSYVPSGKLATVAEFVWLLQHLPDDAAERFLVFGGSRQVADEFLRRWGTPLTEPVAFYFLDGEGLTVLRDGGA